MRVTVVSCPVPARCAVSCLQRCVGSGRLMCEWSATRGDHGIAVLLSACALRACTFSKLQGSSLSMWRPWPNLMDPLPSPLHTAIFPGILSSSPPCKQERACCGHLPRVASRRAPSLLPGPREPSRPRPGGKTVPGRHGLWRDSQLRGSCTSSCNRSTKGSAGHCSCSNVGAAVWVTFCGCLSSM